MNEVRKQLRIASDAIERAKRIIGAQVKIARLLMNEDDLHFLKELALKIGSDTATVEWGLNEFSRISFGAKRFAISKSEAVK